MLKFVHLPHTWANFPRSQGLPAAEKLKAQEGYKKSADLPFAWRNVDRLSTVWGEGEWGDEWVIEYGEFPTPWALAKYGLEERDGRIVDPKGLLGGRPYPEGGIKGSVPGRVVRMEFWDADEWHVLIDGVPAPGWPKRNPYSPHLPLFRARGHESESLLYSLLWLVPRMDELLTMKLNWGYLGSYPNPVVENIPTAQSSPGLDGPISGEVLDQAVVWEPGKIIDMPTGKTLRFLIPPPIGADTNDLLEILRSLIEVAGVPSVMRGSAASGRQCSMIMVVSTVG